MGRGRCLPGKTTTWYKHGKQPVWTFDGPLRSTYYVHALQCNEEWSARGSEMCTCLWLSSSRRWKWSDERRSAHSLIYELALSHLWFSALQTLTTSAHLLNSCHQLGNILSALLLLRLVYRKKGEFIFYTVARAEHRSAHVREPWDGWIDFNCQLAELFTTCNQGLKYNNLYSCAVHWFINS